MSLQIIPTAPLCCSCGSDAFHASNIWSTGDILPDGSTLAPFYSMSLHCTKCGLEYGLPNFDNRKSVTFSVYSHPIRDVAERMNYYRTFHQAFVNSDHESNQTK